FAGAPAGGVESLVVDGKIDVGQQRSNRLEPLQNRRQQLWVCWFGWDVDHFPGCPLITVSEPQKDGARQIFQGNDDAGESVRFRGIVRRTKFEHHLVLRAQVNRLGKAPLAQVEEVEAVAVLAGEKFFRNDTAFDHSWSAPLAGYGGVVAKVPGEV